MHKRRLFQLVAAAFIATLTVVVAPAVSSAANCDEVIIIGGGGQEVTIEVCVVGGGGPNPGSIGASELVPGTCFFRTAVFDDFGIRIFGGPGGFARGDSINNDGGAFGGGPSVGVTVVSSDGGAGLYSRYYSSTGRWLKKWCVREVGGSQGGEDIGGGLEVFPPVASLVPDGPAVTLPELLERAITNLDPPDPPLTVAPDPAIAKQVTVQTPMWWWLPDEYWIEYDQFEANGRLNVTLTGDPATSEFNPGDPLGPEVLVCDGQGEQYTPGADIDGGTDCSYIYRTSAAVAGGTFDTTVTVFFDLSYTTNAPPGPGVITDPPFFRFTDTPLPVGEIQALN